MSKVSIEYFGMPGEGPTLKAAKADAGARLERFVREAGSGVRLVVFGECATLVLRRPGGWCSTLIRHPDKPLASGLVWGMSSGFADEGDAWRSALRHMAQLDWSPAVDDALFFESALEQLPARLRERSDLSELMSWAKFQRCYRASKAAGASDHDAFECGSRHQVYAPEVV